MTAHAEILNLGLLRQASQVLLSIHDKVCLRFFDNCVQLYQRNRDGTCRITVEFCGADVAVESQERHQEREPYVGVLSERFYQACKSIRKGDRVHFAMNGRHGLTIQLVSPDNSVRTFSLTCVETGFSKRFNASPYENKWASIDGAVLHRGSRDCHGTRAVCGVLDITKCSLSLSAGHVSINTMFKEPVELLPMDLTVTPAIVFNVARLSNIATCSVSSSITRFDIKGDLQLICLRYVSGASTAYVRLCQE